MAGDIPRLRRIINGDTEPEATEETAPAESGSGNVVPLPTAQAPATAQAGALVGQAFRGARQRAADLKRRDGNVVKGLRNSAPATVEQQAQWTRDRRWRESGVEEGSWLDTENLLYYHLVGNPAAAFCLACAALFQRQARLLSALLICAPLVPLLIAIIWLVV